MDGTADELEGLGASRSVSCNGGFGSYTVAGEVGAIGLERVLLTIAGLDGGADLVRNEPLLGGSHDEMGGDGGEESRDGDQGSDSELHFDSDVVLMIYDFL